MHNVPEHIWYMGVYIVGYFKSYRTCRTALRPKGKAKAKARKAQSEQDESDEAESPKKAAPKKVSKPKANPKRGAKNKASK